MIGEPCYNPDCNGTYVAGKDSLGCDWMQCSNNPAACDEAIYSYEQAVAHEKAYYAANPEARERFFKMRGFYPGDEVSKELRDSWPGVSTTTREAQVQMFIRKAEFVHAKQYRPADSWPDGVSRAPDIEGSEPSIAYLDVRGSHLNLMEGDWVVRPAAGDPYIVRGDDFARDYETVK